jgi:hypothetical protein
MPGWHHTNKMGRYAAARLGGIRTAFIIGAIISGFAQVRLAAIILNAEGFRIRITTCAPLVGVQIRMPTGLIVDTNNAFRARSVRVCNLFTVSVHADGIRIITAIIGRKSKIIIVRVRAHGSGANLSDALISGFAQVRLAAVIVNAEGLRTSITIFAPLVGVPTRMRALIVDTNSAVSARSVIVCNLFTVSVHADGIRIIAARVGRRSKPIIVRVLTRGVVIELTFISASELGGKNSPLPKQESSKEGAWNREFHLRG